MLVDGSRTHALLSSCTVAHVYLPIAWPAAVMAPGVEEDWEASAIAWLLDVTPPEYRDYAVLRRHPVALASMARYHARACLEGARRAYRTAREELGATIPPHAVDGALVAYRVEGFKLADVVRSVELVERALHGERFTPTLLA